MRFLRLIFVIFIFCLILFLPSKALAFSGYGNGTESYPYQIQTCSQLQEMANDLSAYYQQDNDIDCSDTSFTAIGTFANPFTGTFDGKNFAISNLSLTGSGGYNGLFGSTSNVNIKNVRLVSGSVIDTLDYVGSIIGYAAGTTTLTHSSSQMSVAGRLGVGGLIGITGGVATLQAVYYDGDLSASWLNGGGIVGYFGGTGSSITDCYSAGQISGGSGNYAGITGINSQFDSADISNCYSTMDIETNSGGQNFAGLFGVDKTGTVENSFFAGSFFGFGGLNIGGVIGNSDTTTSGVYLDEYSAGLSNCVGSGSSTCTTVNSGNSQPDYFKGNNTNAPLDSWDFVNTWQINSGDFPTLQGFSSPAPINPIQSTSSTNSSAGSSSFPSCGDSAPTSSPNLFQINSNGNKATLYFVPVSGNNSGYYISYGVTPNAEGFGTSFNYSDTSGVIPYTINYLFPGTWYFKVRGQNGCMPGNWSSVMSVKVGSGVVTTLTQSNKVLGASTSKVTSGKCTSYTVQSGDSLWSIANDKLGSGARYQSISSSNNLSSNIIRVGQKLKVGCN